MNLITSSVLCKVDRPSFNSPNCVRPWWNISPASVMTLGCLPTSERRRARTSTEFQSPALTATTGSVLQFCHLYALIFTSYEESPRGAASGFTTCHFSLFLVTSDISPEVMKPDAAPRGGLLIRVYRWVLIQRCKVWTTSTQLYEPFSTCLPRKVLL